VNKLCRGTYPVPPPTDMTSTRAILDVAETTLEFTALSLDWIPMSARIVAVGAHPKGHGVLSVFALSGRELCKTNSVTTEKPLRCGTFDLGDQQEREFCCGDFSGDLSVWDLETLTQTGRVNAHADILNSIAGGGQDSSEILTGGRDGEVKLWDRRALLRPTVKMLPESNSTKCDCWTVTHSGGGLRLVSAGFDNGDVKVFDLRSTRVLWETNVSRGVSDINIVSDDDCSTGRRLIAGTVQGKLYAWDASAPSANVLSLHMDKSTVWKTQLMRGDQKAILASCLGSGALCFTELRDLNTTTSPTTEHQHMHQVCDVPLISLAVSRDKPGLAATAACDNTIRLFFYTPIK